MRMTSISVEIQSEWESGIVQASKEWIHRVSQDVSQEWTWSGSQAYHKNIHRFTGLSQEHTQVHRHITRTHTGS
jgi:hypothetical protein